MVVYDEAVRLTDRVDMITYNGPDKNGQEPPDYITRAMCKSDVSILMTEKSISHTKARLAACKSGTRVVSMPGITVGMLIRTMCVEFEPVSQLSTKLSTILSQGNSVRVQSISGCDLTFSIQKRNGYADTGDLSEKGAFGNLPAGEAFIAPVEYTASGTLIVDGSYANLNLDSPITIQIDDGVISSIGGGNAATKLRRQLSSLPREASTVCEFGIGTNPNARLSPKILEAEKTLGTCHIAFGRNITFGGALDVAYHADGIIKEPTIDIDGIRLMESGQLV